MSVSNFDDLLRDARPGAVSGNYVRSIHIRIKCSLYPQRGIAKEFYD